MTRGIVLSLYDRSGNMARPWAEAGYDCYCVDVEHEWGQTAENVGDGTITWVGADITQWRPPNEEYTIVFGFPPCKNLAVSGARWFRQKGLDGLASGIELVEHACDIAEWTGAPYMIENPVSVLSSYWRSPNYTFHPYEYDGYTEEDDAYSKKTCLWTSDDFVMPEMDGVEEYDDRIHKMAPSEDRAKKRAETPMGFARAVYHANAPIHLEEATDVSEEVRES